MVHEPLSVGFRLEKGCTLEGVFATNSTDHPVDSPVLDRTGERRAFGVRQVDCTSRVAEEHEIVASCETPRDLQRPSHSLTLFG